MPSSHEAEQPADEVRRWIETVSGPRWSWVAKILSANDTGATGAHQVGLYFPREVIFRLFPSLRSSTSANPETTVHAVFESHPDERDLRVIWYNQRTRNEARITRWGGADSPVQDPEATGSLCVLAFHCPEGSDADQCRIWVCRSLAEEDAVTDLTGPVEPGTVTCLEPWGEGRLTARITPGVDMPCWLERDQIPEQWLLSFPEAQEIVRKSAQHLPTVTGVSPDVRLMRRRECELQIFSSVEEAVVLPRLTEGFAAVDIFVAYANTVLNRRKSRSGLSLELQTRSIFDEEELQHSYNEVSEGRKKPDFLFPSAEDYRDPAFSTERLRMLGAKTTCKDRWRQILTEADRIERKHLITLQEGVSEHQFREMEASSVVLVVPEPLHLKYPASVRPQLLTLSQFITETAVL